MSKHVSIKPTSKPIQTYYEALQSYGAQGVEHEGALETAFQRLLADTARLELDAHPEAQDEGRR